MFDNPKKDLERLQRRLLEAEDPDYEEETEYEEDPDEDTEEALEEVKELLDQEEIDREPVFQRYGEEYADEDYEGSFEAPEPPKRKKQKKQKRKADRGLVTAMVLEGLALLAVAAWWLLWE